MKLGTNLDHQNTNHEECPLMSVMVVLRGFDFLCTVKLGVDFGDTLYIC